MSIANNSLLRRILVEVRDAPAPGGVSEPERSQAQGWLLELRRTTRVHEPPFATSLHFWAHALRAFLEDHRRPELFEALAANCLCEAIPAEQARATLREICERVSPGPRIETGDGLLGVYRMIDQELLASWVSERSDEFVALFWTRPDWLATAQLLPPE